MLNSQREVDTGAFIPTRSTPDPNRRLAHRQHISARIPTERRLALSAFWWNDLTADFAARIGLGMDVDVPLAGGKLLRLLARVARLPLNAVFRRAALLAPPRH